MLYPVGQKLMGQQETHLDADVDSSVGRASVQKPDVAGSNPVQFLNAKTFPVLLENGVNLGGDNSTEAA